MLNACLTSGDSANSLIDRYEVIRREERLQFVMLFRG